MAEPWDDREKRLENMEAEARRVEEAVYIYPYVVHEFTELNNIELSTRGRYTPLLRIISLDEYRNFLHPQLSTCFEQS
ncbi:MAG: hypothetical protein WBP88_04380 [Nitrososphaeraceae archaeon]